MHTLRPPDSAGHRPPDRGAWVPRRLPALDLDRALMRLVRQIPRRHVATYGDLAGALGDPRATRWVATRLLHHAHHPDCLCHRVIRKDGSFTDPNSSARTTRFERLARDGIAFLEGDPSRVVAATPRWRTFRATWPLRRLQRWQELASQRINPSDTLDPFRFVGGVDVSYAAEDLAVASLVVVDLHTQSIVGNVEHTTRISFPYVSGYLAFRECPPMLDVLDEAKALGLPLDAVLVDGSGILHPRRCGLACLVGLFSGVPSIGVTKSHLWGTSGAEPGTDRPSTEGDRSGGLLPIQVDHESRGFARRVGSRRWIYASPGHAIGIAAVERLLLQCPLERGLPWPIALADRFSRRSAQVARRDQPIPDK